MRAALATLLCATAVLAAGCGAVSFFGAEGTDPVRGKQLYQENCLSCHVLENAGQGGPIGPNLDEALGIPRSQGFDESTIRNVVRGQIAYPDERPTTGTPGMQAHILTGQDARDVSQYVAMCAGVPDCGVGD